MVIIQKQSIIDILKMEYLSELYQVREKIRFFQEKYEHNFKEFSDRLHKEEENFEHYDDYMEWKAYTQLLSDIQKKIEDLNHGNFQVA